MKREGKKRGDWAKIVLAVAGKDIVDAIKNRVTISIILAIAMLILITQALPLVSKLRPEKRAYVFDASGSTFVENYENDGSHRLIEMPSREALLAEIGGVVDGAIGLVLPADFPQRLQGTEPLEVDLYFSHAMKGSKAGELAAFFTRELGAAAGREVNLMGEGNEVFPAPDAGGHPFMVRISLAVSILTVGLSLVPLLMVEEKEKHTLEVLLVSPASYGQIILGKALTGLFYCMTAAAVVFAVNYRLIAMGWVALLAVLGASLFTVALGLLMGVLFDQPANLNMVVGLLLMLLLAIMLLSALDPSALPATLNTLLPYTPPFAMGELFGISFSNNIAPGTLLFNLAVLFGFALLLLLLVLWRVRRMDR